MYGNKVSILLGVAALAAVATSTPVSQQRPETPFTEPDVFTAVAQVAQVILSKNKEFSQNQPFEGPVEMHLSGFSAVIRTAGEQDTKEETTQCDQPLALTARPRMEGYERKGSSIYKYHTTGADWQTAKATCEREGAHLAIADSDDEAQLLVDLFESKSRDVPYYTNEMWVGVSDIAEEGHFVTVLGDDLSSTGFSTWFGENPDDWTDIDSNGEDCVTLKRLKSLNDLHCSATVAFICEADASAWPEAPAMQLLSYIRHRFIID